MALRTRETVIPVPTGTAWRSFVQYGPFPDAVSYSRITTDEVGVGDHRQFSSETRSFKGGRINWDMGPGTGQFLNFLADYWRSTVASNGWAHWNLPVEQSDIAYSTIAAGRTNPSRPYVDVVTNALQLAEITHLIKRTGDTFLQKFGQLNLALEFGVYPVLDDLNKLVHSYEQVMRRAKELERLRSGRGLRRTIPLGKLDHQEYKYSDGGGWVQTVYWFVHSGSNQSETIMDVGAHIRWKPTMDLSHLSNERMLALAKKAVKGLTFDASSAWQLIPWSWLADYGTTIGDFFEATRNIIPAEPSEISITKRKRTRLRWAGWETVANGGLLTSEPFEYTIDSKTRHRVDVIAPVAQLPFLSATQMGILASIAATQGKL